MLGDWNDPKSRLQQCCLLRRDPSEKEPQMPRYKYVTHGSRHEPSICRIFMVQYLRLPSISPHVI